ncbi:unnamed protein product, partial [Rotaria socialis]
DPIESDGIRYRIDSPGKWTRFIKLFITQQRLINNSIVFPDETLNHLFASNPGSLPIVKILRDQYEHQLDEDREIRGQYERLIQEKERVCKTMRELCDEKEKENLNNRRNIMFYEGTLHTRGLFEEFTGYLQGVIQPNSISPMSRKNYTKKDRHDFQSIENQRSYHVNRF